MKIQPVTDKEQTAYPVLSKAAVLTAVSAVSLISASCDQEVQRTSGLTPQPQSDALDPDGVVSVQCLSGFVYRPQINDKKTDCVVPDPDVKIEVQTTEGEIPNTDCQD